MKWAKENNITTMSEFWIKCPYPEFLLDIMEMINYGSDKDLRLFACWCAKQTFMESTNIRCINAVGVAERFANNKATKKELNFAFNSVSCYQEGVENNKGKILSRDAKMAQIADKTTWVPWAAARGATWKDVRSGAWATVKSDQTIDRTFQADKLRNMFNNPFVFGKEDKI